ncbi:WD40 repeat domain-containing protein [Actinomadura graeca]|nr:hypothetical protein [Actinomadura graeca]
MTGKQQQVLRGHTDSVFNVTPLTGGTVRLASVGRDQTVRIWEPSSGQQLGVIAGHSDVVRGVCEVKLGGTTLLASASNDQTVRLWNPDSGEQVMLLSGHRSSVYRVCAFELGAETLLASGASDHTVRVWDLATGQTRHILDGQTFRWHERQPDALTGRIKVLVRCTCHEHRCGLFKMPPQLRHVHFVGHPPMLAGRHSWPQEAPSALSTPTSSGGPVTLFVVVVPPLGRGNVDVRDNG